jgi:pyruvate dehydrogenase E2 component (dihydrolipoamide acetyltransferase)
MEIRVVVPQIGEAVAQLTLVQWYKGEGDHVKKGDPLFAVDSDKSVIDVEAWDDGVLTRILAPAGATVMPNDEVAVLETALSVPPAPPPSQGAAPPAPRVQQPTAAARPRVRTAASPRARRLAVERGVSLEGLRGSGVRGMVTAADVARVAGAAPAAAAPGPAAPGAGATSMRAAIAERTARSAREAPHFYLTVEVDFAAARDAAVRGDAARGGLTALVVCACARALRELPECNVSWRDGRAIRLPGIAVGVAVAVAGGILVPAIADPDRLPPADLRRALAEIIEHSRAGRVQGPSVRSMVVSNLGMFGIDEFHAIIDPPDPMILAVGAVRDRVVAVGGAPAVRPTALLSLSADHRVLDGVPAARFLARVRALLESPEVLQ